MTQPARNLPPAASPGSPEADRIRSYLQSQAAKLSLSELSSKVRSDMEQVRVALHAVPAQRFAERPAADDWSANEIAYHLTQTSSGVAAGIRAALAGNSRPPTIADQMGPAASQQDAASWWNGLLADREALLARVAQAKGDEHLDITWPHGVFGELNWREWLLFMRVHDLDHGRQLQAVAEALAR